MTDRALALADAPVPLAPPGPVLFARYALGPNRLGLCGPGDWHALLGLGAAGTDDPALRQLAQGFEGAWPYLELLAGAAGIRDPLDPRVVEAYWLGGDAAAVVSVGALGRSIEDRFRDRASPAAWRWLATKPEAGALPVHAFHVLDVMPAVGLLRGAPVGDLLRVMDACRIRWGTVRSVIGDEVVVETPRLEMADGRLRLAPPSVETVRRSIDGTGLARSLEPGDHVSLHWDWVCDRLDARQLRTLVRTTEHQLGLANRTI